MASSFFLELSFAHTLGLAFCCMMLMWAVLWSIESHTLKKKLHHMRALLKDQQDILGRFEVPMAMICQGIVSYSNAFFENILGGGASDNLKNAILQLLEKEFQFRQWDDFSAYLTLHIKAFSYVFEKQNDFFCLYAHMSNGTVCLWIEPVQRSGLHMKKAHALMDDCPIPLWYRGETGEISYCNRAYASIFDKSRKDVIDQQMEIIPAARANSVYHQTQKALQAQSLLVQRHHVIVGSKRQYSEIGVLPCSNSGAMGYMLDLNEVDQLHREKKLLLEGQKEIFEHLSTSIAIYDQHMRLVFFNRAYINCFQFDENWLLTQPTLNEVLEDLRARRKIPEVTDFQAHKKNRMALFQSLQHPLQEISHYPDGRVLRMMIVPYKLGGVMYTFDDMSETLTLESRYNTLIAVQNETIDNLFEGILVFGSDYRLHLMNASFSEILGHGSNDQARHMFIGRTLQDCLESPFFMSFAMTKIEVDDVNQGGANSLHQIFIQLFEKRKMNEGTVELEDKRVLRMAYSPLPDGSHLLSFVDITDTARFQNRLKERNALLEEQAMMRAYFMEEASKLIQKEDAFKQGSGLCEQSKEILSSLLHIAASPHGPVTFLEEEICVSDFHKILLSLSAFERDACGPIDLENHIKSDIFRGDQKILIQGLWFLLSKLSYHCGEGARIQLSLSEDGDRIVFSISMIPFVWKETYGTGVHMHVGSYENDHAMHAQSRACGIPFLKRVVALHGGEVNLTWPNDVSEMLRIQACIPRFGHQTLCATELLRSA